VAEEKAQLPPAPRVTRTLRHGLARQFKRMESPLASADARRGEAGGA